MNSKRTLTAVALAGLLLVSALASAGSVAGSTAANATANDSLSVSVENVGNDGATVMVTANDSAVANASVSVEATDNNSTYAGAGDYETGPDGTVSLPEPEQNVTVSVTAESGNLSETTTATLTTAEESDEPKSFGQMVSSFVHQMLNAGDTDGPLGQAISEFVTSNNPGSEHKPDHAGKPDDAGKKDTGKPAHAGGPDNSTAEGDDDQSPGNSGNGNDETDDDKKGNGNDKAKKGNNGKGN
ncbi:hypothetical protein [Halorussus halophilus]|uniref:hypothetical protein n=1 Tax=Halorussus halophilus TaxID=2650975 RepID=UPI001300F818|nr:hypothetical protein [Halorussus halophilus]